MDQPGSSRVAAAKKSPPVVSAPKTAEPMAAAADIGPISAYEQLASLSADGRPNPAHVLALQRAAGNRAVGRFMAGRNLQTKINPDAAGGGPASESARGARQAKPLPAPGPRRVAASRSRGRPADSPPGPASHAPIAQRIARLEDEEMPGAPAPRPGAGFDASPDFESRLTAARGSGASLPDATRAFMEQRIGADFGAVKVHTDARSDALNEAIQAKAFTTGQDVFFRQGAFEPATSGGKELIAHELTHVVQQTGAAMRAPKPEPPVLIAPTSAGARAIQAKTRSSTNDASTPTAKEEGQTTEPHTPTLEEELVAEGVAEPTSFAVPAPKPGGLAKLGASFKSAVRPNVGNNPVKTAINKLDRAAVDRIVDLISKEQLVCTPQQLSWLGQRDSALQADPGSYETTLAQELAWEKAASIAMLDRPGLERILRLIRDNKLKVKPDELQQLGRRNKALMADASTYETTLANELAFEQAKGISELDRDGLDRIVSLIDDGKLMVTPAERQQLGRRRKVVGGASVPGELTLADALAREGVTTIGALEFDGVERVVELVDDKKLRLEPAQLQQLGRRRAALEAAGDKAARITMAVALAREGAETIGQLDLAGVDGIADLIPQNRIEITPRQIQQLGERRRQLLTSAKTVTQYLKDKLAEEVARGTQTKGTRVKKVLDLDESEAEMILDLVETKMLRATNREYVELSRFRKAKPAERERYETTFEDELAWEGATKVDQLSVEAAERIRELVADKKLKATTAQLQQLASLRRAKPAPGADKTTLEKELARHGAATIDELDLEGIDAIRRLVAEKKLDLTVNQVQDLVRELGRRHKTLTAAQTTEETTLELEMAREGLGAQEFDKLDLDGVERLLSLVEGGTLKLGTATLLALGQHRNRQKAIPGEYKTNLELEMARHGATKIAELDLEGVEAILELTAAAEPARLEVPDWMLRGLGQRRRTLLQERETKKPTLADELRLRAAAGVNDLNLEALDEINELIVDGKLKLLPSEREQIERRRKQQREAANAGKPKFEELLAREGAETIAELDFEAADRILSQIRYDGLKIETRALLELVRQHKSLAVAGIATGTFDEELANEGALRIADLDSGGVDRLWDLVEGGKLEVTNAQLLELARRRKEFSTEPGTIETSLEEELAREDVDGISALDFAGITRIWRLVELSKLEISPDQLRELAQRRKAVLSEPRTYETTLKYELARARANSIADLDMSEVANILELAEAGDLALSNADLAQLVRRQKEEAYDGRALKALLADRKDRSIGSLTPLSVSILWSLAEQKKLLLSVDQRRELAQRRKDQAANPHTLETELDREGAKSIAGLTPSAVKRIWTRLIEQEFALKPDELKALTMKAGKNKGDAQAHAEKEATRLEERLVAFENRALQQKGMRRMSMTEPGPLDDQDAVSQLDIEDIPPSLREALSSFGVTQIGDLSFTEAEDIIGRIEANLFRVTNDELRQLIRLRNDERKKREPEATTLEYELSMEGVTTIAELDLEGAERIWYLVSTNVVPVAIEKRRELAKRRATLLSPRKPEVMNLESELATEGVVEIVSLDAAGLRRISALVESGELKVTPAQLRQLVQRRKELRNSSTTLAEELAAEGVAAINELDLEGVQRIIRLVEGNELKVAAGELRQLYWREEKVNQDPAKRITLVKELIRAQVDSIEALALDEAERIIALIEGGRLKVDAAQLRALYELDARLSEAEQGEESALDETESSEESGTTTQPEALTTPSEPTRRMRSNALVGRSIGAELATYGVSDIDGLDLTAVRRLIGMVEDGRLTVLTGQRRRLYWHQSKLTEPTTDAETTQEDETPDVLEELEDSVPDEGLKEPMPSPTRRWVPGRSKRDSVLDSGFPEQTGRQRRYAVLGRNRLVANLSQVLAREGVEDIAGLDFAGATRIRKLAASGDLPLTTSDASALAAKLRELERIEELGQTTFERALQREDAADIDDLDLGGVERIRELLATNKIKPMPGNDALLRLGQQRKALLSKENQGRTTLQAELGKEKAKGIGDLSLDGVERIRGLLAEKKLEVTPAELVALAQRRSDLLSTGGPGEPTLDDELALEGVETIDALDLNGVNRIRALIAAKRLTVAPGQLYALGKQRMTLLASRDTEKTTLESELALEGVAKIADLDRDGVSRIKDLVETDRLDISPAELKELGLRYEALPLEPEPEEASLTVELAREGVARIAELDLAGVKRIRDLARFKTLDVSDPELEQLRQRQAVLEERVTLADFLAGVGAQSIAGLGRDAMIDIWKLVVANKLRATEAEIRELALKRKGQQVEVMSLSEYLADTRNATNDGRDARTIDSLNEAEIGAILNLIDEKRLIAEPAELKELARARKALRSAPKSEPTSFSGALAHEGVKDIAALDLAAIERLWERVADRTLRIEPDERRQLGQRRRKLLNESRTLQAAVANTGAGSIADLALADVLDLWDRVAEGALTAEPEERMQLGERRKSRMGDSLTLAFELEREGAKDVASLNAEAVERIWQRIKIGDLQVSTDVLRELARRHKYETGDEVRTRKLEALADLAGNTPGQRKIQTKLIVGPVGDRYEQEADRVARHVVSGPAPVQPQPVDEYYRGPAYPSSAKRLRAQRSIQARLTVGPVGDRYEQAADRVARQVLAMRMPESGDEYFSGSAYAPRSASAPAPIQHGPAPVAVDDLQARALAQRSGAAFDAGVDFEERLGAARASGAPLPDSTRAFMERRMGADFGGVRVHADAQAGQLNRLIQAKAFTMGGDVFFGPGEYNPGSSSGKELLAHELAHTVQQGAAPIQRRIPQTEAPIAASEDVEDAAQARDEAEASAPRPPAGQPKPASVRRTADLPETGIPADTRADTGTPIAAGATRPHVQRHLLGSLGDLGRSILATLASIPENLWAALRPASGIDQAPAGKANPLAAPALPAPEEAPLQPVATNVGAPSRVEPAISDEALTPESIRAKVNLFDPTGGDVLRYISDRISDVGSINDLLFIVSRERLVDALANDMAARGGAVPVDETHTQAAEREVANGGGGFTALDGRIFILDTAAKSSALFHEVIHVLSGPGGVTPLAQLKMQLNEGFTNYFAEEVAGLVGGEVYAAYMFPTEWVRKFAAAHGRDAAYNIYFKANIELLYEKMAGFLLKQAQASQLKDSEANLLKLRGEWSMDKALAMVKAKVKGADFFDKNALPNQWFDGRVF